MLNTAFEPWPSFTQEEANAVSQVLLSNKVNYWTGQECREFEKEFAHYTATKYAIALANGTVALDLALKALGIGPGDDVIVTSRTFLASASSIVTAGANPIFADVELDSQNISRATIEAVLTPDTKAIICVHLAGWMCDMDPIMQLAVDKGLYVIEDCAQAHGAQYKGRRPVPSVILRHGHFVRIKLCPQGVKAVWSLPMMKRCGKKCGLIKIMARILTVFITSSIHQAFAGYMIHLELTGA